ncbi:unnamed protein product [Fraxinus pennsylvanica]|uniref:C2 domain-containing protein n=1 Tax=Fraxinus pennsylvanica TaxID=56036 RepID=A0AAD1YN18_9LAMI|nr:unnamed protein product [Fraxinus pennsylvanica]
MECRRLQITIISANNLPKVHDSGSTKIYAKASIAGKHETKRRTPVDNVGENNPQWNYNVPFTLTEAVVQHDSVDLHFKLYFEQKFKDNCIGEVKLSLKKLFDEDHSGESRISCSVLQGDDSLVQNGTLNLSYSFGEIYVIKKPSIFVRALQFLLATFVGCPPNACVDVDVIKP